MGSKKVTGAARKYFVGSRQREKLRGACQAILEGLEDRIVLTAGPVGPAFGVNAIHSTLQYQADIASDQNGRFVVVWSSQDQDGSYDGIYARLFAADGSALTDEFQVNTFTQDAQTMPAVAMDAAGDFVIAWASSPQGGIMARQYTPAGASKGAEFLALDHYVYNAGIACDAVGDFVITGETNNGGVNGTESYAQRFAADGTKLGGRFQVNVGTTGNQSQPQPAMDAAGNFVVTWYTGSSLFLRRFDALGNPLTTDVQVNTTAGLAASPNASIAMDDAGDSLIVWADGQEISGQRYSASGTPQGANFVVNSETDGTQRRPSAGMSRNGQAVVTWSDDSNNAFGQVFSSTGQRLGGTFKVYPSGAGAFDLNTATISDNDNLVVTWEGQDDPNSSTRGIFARRFNQFSNPVSAGDKVWIDTNGNGIFDATESGTNGVSVSLFTTTDGLIDTATTANGGTYRFDGLRPDQPYYLQFSRPNNLVFTAKDQGSDDTLDSDVDPATGLTAPFSISAGGSDLTRDAGLTSPGSISGTIFNDLDNDGARTGSEGSLSRWIVYLDLNRNGQRDSGEPIGFTDSTGKYTISGLSPGSYVALPEVQTGWALTSATSLATVTPGKTTTANAIGLRTSVVPRFSGPQGSEFPVNTTTQDRQTTPAIAINADGSYVITWASNQDGSDQGIYAQRFSATGTPAGAEFLVNQTTTGAQYDPAITIDGNGNFSIVWTTDQAGSQDIFMRRFDATGAPLGGEQRVNTFVINTQNTSSIASDPAGNLIVTWSSISQDGSGGGIYAQRFDASGAAVGVEFRVNTLTASDQLNPAVAVNASDQFVIVWDSNIAPFGRNIEAQIYSPNGSPLGTEFRVNDYTGSQSNPSVAMFPDGRFVVAWQGFGQEQSGNGILAKRFKATGAAESQELIVNTYINLDQIGAAVSADADGNFAVVWQSATKDGSVGLGLQRFDAAGRPFGVELQPNTFTPNDQTVPAIAMNASGNFVVAWSSASQDNSSEGIFAQRYTITSNPASVGDYVWNDVDGDGVQDATETGADNVTVTLFNSDGLLIDSTITAGGGKYRFDGLKAGSYYFQLSPTTLLATISNQNVSPQFDSDINPLTLRSGTFALSDNQVDLTRDAGLVTPATISGTIFNDLDGNGVRDATDTALSGWKVYADLNGNGTPDANEPSTTSSALGAYTLGNLPPGQYTVRAVNLPLWTQTTPASAQVVNLPVGYSYKGEDIGFAFPTPARIARTWGAQFRVNTTTNTFQVEPAVAFDASGNYVVVWRSAHADPAGDIFAQRFDALDRPLGAEFRVNEQATGAQIAPSVAMSASGDFVVVWQSASGDGDGSAIIGRRFNAAGVAQGGDFVVNSTTAGNQTTPAVAMDSAGDFVAAWHTNTGGATPKDESQARIFAPTGAPQGADFIVSDLNFAATDKPAITMRGGNGDFIVTFAQTGKDGSDKGVFAQRYDLTGAAVGSLFQVNTTTAGAQDAPAVGFDSAGNFVVTWESQGQDGSGWGIVMRRFDAQANPLGGESTANIYTAGDQRWPVIGVEPSGNFVVSWASASGGYASPPTTSGPGNYAARFDSAGNRVGGEFRTDANTAGGTFDTSPVLGMSTSGAFLAIHAGSEVYAQHFEQFSNPGSLGGMVWDDADGDGVRDLGEAGHDGVTVRIYTSAGFLVDSTKTAGGGLYRFDLLEPGLSYFMEFVAPSGTVFTRQDQGSDTRDSDADISSGRTSAVALGPNQVDLTRDAGLVSPGSISGTVFNDKNSDGLETAGETGISSWQVVLDLNNDGKLSAGDLSTAVSTTGAYQFTGLSPGTYHILLVPQKHWTFTSPPQAGNVSLLAGQNRLGVDLGVHTDVPPAPLAPVGPETGVVPAPLLLQFDYSTVAMDGAGNFIVVWQTRETGTDYHIRAQRYAADGTAIGASFLVHTDPLYQHTSPAVAMNSAGDFVVSWYYSDRIGQVKGIYARKFNADGTPLTDQFGVNTGTATGVANESISMDNAGNFVIAWESGGQDGNGVGIYARRFDKTGAPVGNEFLVNTNNTVGDQVSPRVDMTPSGAFDIGWVDSGSNLFLQQYQADGTPDGTPIQLNVVSQSVLSLAIGVGDDGDFVAAWDGSDAGQSGLLVRRFDSQGNPQSLPAAITTPASYWTVAMDGGDNYTVVYQAADGSGAGIFAQRFNAAGVLQGTPFRVNTAISGDQSHPALAANSLGNAVVVYNGILPIASQPDILFQRLGAAANPGTVSGIVWADYNGDGIRQAGEPGLDGIGVQLTNAFGAPAASVTTSGGGLYRFDSLLPGATYNVIVSAVSGRVPSPRNQGADPAKDSDIDSASKAQVSVQAGASTQIDAGFAAPASIAGVVFNDINSDGVRQSGEIPLPGFSVYLDFNSNNQLDAGEPTAVTAADGSFKLSNLISGPYRLALVPQDAWTSTAPASAFNGTLTAGQNLSGVALGQHTSAPMTQGVPIGPSAVIGTAALLPGSATAMEAAGNFVVTWIGQDAADPNSELGIFARRFSADGTPLGAQFQVNTITVSNQTAPAIAMDAAGDFVIVWQDNGNGQFIAAQRFNAAGEKQGGQIRVSTLYGNWFAQHVVMRNDGSFVISWSGTDGIAAELPRVIYAQLYASNGAPIGGNFLVNSAQPDGNHDEVALGIDSDNNLRIVWNYTTVGNPAFDLGVYEQRISSTGVNIGAPILLEPSPSGIYSGTAFNPAGDFFVALVGVSYAHFNASGVEQGAPLAVGNGNNGNVRPAIAIDPQGNIIVAYADYRGGWGVYLRRFNAAGVPQGTEMRIDPGYGTGTDSGAVQGISISTSAGGFAVAWTGPTVRVFRTAQAGDADGDGKVGFSDLVKVAQDYGGTGKSFSDGDFNGDGKVDFADLVTVAQKYGTTPAAPVQAAAAPPTVLNVVDDNTLENPEKKSLFSVKLIKTPKPPTPPGKILPISRRQKQ